MQRFLKCTVESQLGSSHCFPASPQLSRVSVCVCARENTCVYMYAFYANESQSSFSFNLKALYFGKSKSELHPRGKLQFRCDCNKKRSSSYCNKKLESSRLFHSHLLPTLFRFQFPILGLQQARESPPAHSAPTLYPPSLEDVPWQQHTRYTCPSASACRPKAKRGADVRASAGRAAEPGSGLP